MIHNVGRVHAIVRYPVKSMAGTVLETALLGWHGLEGDRRFAFRRVGDESGFPWLSASRLPELLLYHPFTLHAIAGEPLPTHVRTPAGACLAIRSMALRAEIAGRLGGDVEMMQFRHGIFDDAPLSVISLATMDGIGREAGRTLDSRRFRANVILETEQSRPFHEDGWVGGTLVFGENERSPAVTVTACDVRCAMLNLDPETAAKDGRVMQAVVRLNNNNAGVYGMVVRTGTIRVGDRVRLIQAPMDVSC